MSKRKYGAFPLVFTYTPEALEGLNTRECLEMANKDLKALFQWLRKKANANDWKYTLNLSPSVKDCRSGKAVRLHIHGALFMYPAWTGIHAIKEYWEGRKNSIDRRQGRKIASHRGGIVRVDCRGCQNVEKLLQYMKAQSPSGKVLTQTNIKSDEKPAKILEGYEVKTINHVNNTNIKHIST